MSRNIAALISLGVVFTGSIALSIQSVEAKPSDSKTSRNSSHKARNYLVPPPPPYTPSIVPSVLSMAYAQAAPAADDAIAMKTVNPYSRAIFTRNQGDTQVAQPNPYASYDRGVETKVQKHIDSFDSEISSKEKEIGKLLNL